MSAWIVEEMGMTVGGVLCLEARRVFLSFLGAARIISKAPASAQLCNPSQATSPDARKAFMSAGNPLQRHAAPAQHPGRLCDTASAGMSVKRLEKANTSDVTALQLSCFSAT